MMKSSILALAVVFMSASVATAQSAKDMDDAVSKCLFDVTGTEYVFVTMNSKNGVHTLRVKKTKKARKDKISKAKFAEIKSNYTQCIVGKVGNENLEIK